MRREPVRGEDVLERRPDLDFARELVRLGEVDVPDDLVAAPPAAASSRPQLPGDPRRDVVEVGPAGTQEVEPSLQLGRCEHLTLDLRRHMGDAPEVGRARPGHAFDDLHVARPLELAPQPRPLGDPGVPRHVGQQLLDGVLLRRAPAIEAGPVHGARDDPARLADLEDEPQVVGRVGHRDRIVAEPGVGWPDRRAVTVRRRLHSRLISAGEPDILRTFEIGVVLPLMQFGAGSRTSAAGRPSGMMALRAEEIGFDTIWTPDELVWQSEERPPRALGRRRRWPARSPP